MKPVELYRYVIMPACAWVNKPSERAAVILLSAAYQETKLEARVQGRGGPAHSLLQFEKGNATSKGGLWGVFNHPASKSMARWMAATMLYNPDDLEEIHNAIVNNDLLAFGLGRLLLWTDPRELPEIGNKGGAYEYYDRNWRPGKKRPQDWDESYQVAMAAFDDVQTYDY